MALLKYRRMHSKHMCRAGGRFSILIGSAGCQRALARQLGGSGGMPPRKMLILRPSENTSDALFEQESADECNYTFSLYKGCRLVDATYTARVIYLSVRFSKTGEKTLSTAQSAQ